MSNRLLHVTLTLPPTEALDLKLRTGCLNLVLVYALNVNIIGLISSLNWRSHRLFSILKRDSTTQRVSTIHSLVDQIGDLVTFLA